MTKIVEFITRDISVTWIFVAIITVTSLSLWVRKKPTPPIKKPDVVAVVVPKPKPECDLSADGKHHYGKWNNRSEKFQTDNSILQDCYCDSCGVIRIHIIRPSNTEVNNGSR